MHELNAKDRKRYHDLFVKLDVNSDGKVDVNDLVALFEQNKVSDCQQSHLARAQVSGAKARIKRVKFSSNRIFPSCLPEIHRPQ